jgi:hypothetical protein
LGRAARARRRDPRPSLPPARSVGLGEEGGGAGVGGQREGGFDGSRRQRRPAPGPLPPQQQVQSNDGVILARGRGVSLLLRPPPRSHTSSDAATACAMSASSSSSLPAPDMGSSSGGPAMALQGRAVWRRAGKRAATLVPAWPPAPLLSRFRRRPGRASRDGRPVAPAGREKHLGRGAAGEGMGERGGGRGSSLCSCTACEAAGRAAPRAASALARGQRAAGAGRLRRPRRPRRPP